MKFDLNGQWSLSSPEMPDVIIPAQLPGDNYSALFNAGIIPDPYYGKNEEIVQKYRKYKWSFKRDFEVSAEMLAKKYIYLEVSMADTFIDCRINGKKVFSGKNAFTAYRPEVKKYLKEGTNNIEFIFYPVEAEADKYAKTLPLQYPMIRVCSIPRLNLIRKTHCHGGWDWNIILMVSGIYEPVILNCTDYARLETIYVSQKHEKNTVKVTAFADIYAEKNEKITVTFKFNGEIREVKAVLEAGKNTVKTDFTVKNPRLWWPAGYGAPELYELTVSTPDSDITRNIGLREIEIINEKDEFGTSFGFRVNGTDIFAKGANWVPCDAMPSRHTPERYESLIDSAVKANMNMLRVWGGGQYEKDIFYDICDKKGVLLYHDLMFSCSLYPSTDDFIENVMDEIEYQIPRLKSHPSIAMWCGDNEGLGATGWYGGNRTQWLINYDRLNTAIGKAVKRLDPDRVFWPSSPCGGPGSLNDGWHDDSSGDMHYWSVWQDCEPFSSYYNIKPRFCSEFGYASFPSMENIKNFCPENQLNAFSPVMDFHQRNFRGNSAIIGMFGSHFRMPESFEKVVYLSQLQQSIAIKTAVEYWRSLKPRCMGTLFWQLNEPWPVVGWSSLEYYGNWKQLMYHTKRFYAPLISVMYQSPENKTYKLFCISDVDAKAKVSIELDVVDMTGKIIDTVKFKPVLAPGECRCIKTFKEKDFNAYPDTETFFVIRTNAESAKGNFAHENVFCRQPYKAFELPECDIKTKIKEIDNSFEIILSSNKAAFYVTMETPGIKGIFSDNSFMLLPGREKTVRFTVNQQITSAELKKVMTIEYLNSKK